KQKYDVKLSVYVYQRTLEEYHGKPRALAKAINDFGFTDVYISFSRSKAVLKENQDYLRELISSLSKQNIQAHALAFTESNAFGEEQKETLEIFDSFQSVASDEERFIGINFDIEPHIMREGKMVWKKVSDKYKLDHIGWQSADGYGKNGPNSKT